MNDTQINELQKVNRKRPWNMRGFVSLLLFLQSIVLIVSGVVRYISPRGREAHWVDWRVWGLDKDQWSSIHMVAGLLFVALAVIHILYNFRPMLSYVRKKGKTLQARGRELALAVILTIVICVLTIMNITPASSLFIYSEDLKEDYAASIQRAPWPHAEDTTVEKLCKRLGAPLDKALDALKQANLPARNSTETLLEIACRHHTSPAHLYTVICNGCGLEEKLNRPTTSPGRCSSRSEKPR